MTISNFKTCLFICPNAIGDILVTLPSIHFLRAKGYLVDILVNIELKDIFAADQNVNEVIAVDGNFLYENLPKLSEIKEGAIGILLGRTYDLIIDSMSTPSTGELTKLLSPVKSVGIQFSSTSSYYVKNLSRNLWLSWADSNRNVVDCFGDLLRLAKLDFKPSSPTLYLSDSAKKYADDWFRNSKLSESRTIAINPGAGYFLKRYPLERYFQLSSMFKECGYDSIFIFGPNEDDLFKSYKSKIDYYHYSSTSEVQKVASILKGCKCVISNDSAVMHISASLKIPTVAIFGPSKSLIWFPYEKEGNRVIQRNVDCRDRCNGDCSHRSCLMDISIEEIFQTTQSLLAAC